jgi:hypothetical protein
VRKRLPPKKLRPPAAAWSELRPGAHRESMILKGETEALSD